MLKIFPSRISGTLIPASLDKSIISSLALATVSKEFTDIKYKGLSDTVMCAVNALERAGAVMSISNDRISVTPSPAFPESLYLNFHESDTAFLMLVPFIKTRVSNLEADYSERLSKKTLSSLLEALELGGCKIKSRGNPLRLDGLFSNIPSPNTYPELSDALSLCSMNGEKDGVRSAIDFFKGKEGRVFFADSDPLYLSYFVAASDTVECGCEIPTALCPFIKSEKTSVGFRHTPSLKPFVSDASALGEFLLPCIILAIRTSGACVFENYMLTRSSHARLMQMLSDLSIRCKLQKNRLTVLSDGRINVKKIRAWQDESFVIAACLCACLSQGESILDSERSILIKYPTFFDDLRALGGSFQNL